MSPVASEPDPEPRVPLTRARAVSAALELLDRDGLEAFSMRKLGRELGVDPMAVYHHVPDKAALFDGVVERIMASVEVPPAAGPDSRVDTLVAFARAFRAVLLEHPNVLPIVATRQVTGPAGLALVERGIAALRAAGFDLVDARDAVVVTATFVIGHALAQAGPPAGGSDEPDLDQLAATLDLDSLPNIVEAIGLEWDWDRQFELGLEALRSGFETKLG